MIYVDGTHCREDGMAIRQKYIYDVLQVLRMKKRHKFMAVWKEREIWRQ